MRKVLLATTALAAVAGVTAANADLSISGNYEWEYVSNDAGTQLDIKKANIIKNLMLNRYN